MELGWRRWAARGLGWARDCGAVLRGGRARVVLGMGVTGVFVFLFLRNTDFDGVARAFEEASLWWIGPALAAYFAGVAARAWRWRYLLMHLEAIAWWRLFPIVAIGFGVNNVLPLRTGELVRAQVLYERHGISRWSGLSSIFMTRVYDGLMLTVFLCVGVGASVAGVGGMTFAGWWLTGAMVFLVFGMIGAFVVFGLAPRRADAVERWAGKVWGRLPVLRDRGLGWLRSVIDGMGAQANRRQVTGALWTSLAAWGLEAAMYWMVGEAFGLGLPFAVYLLVAAAANLLITVPTTSGGVGPFEWATKAVLLIWLPALGSAEHPEEAAIAYAATLHGLVLVPIAIVGLGFLWLFQTGLASGPSEGRSSASSSS